MKAFPNWQFHNWKSVTPPSPRHIFPAMLSFNYTPAAWGGHKSLQSVLTGPSSEMLIACSTIKTFVGRRLETLADRHFKWTFSVSHPLSLHISVVELLSVFRCTIKCWKNAGQKWFPPSKCMQDVHKPCTGTEYATRMVINVFTQNQGKGQNVFLKTEQFCVHCCGWKKICFEKQNSCRCRKKLGEGIRTVTPLMNYNLFVFLFGKVSWESLKTIFKNPF